MKFILFSLCLLSNLVYGQWTTSGNDTYNTNTGHVLVGSATNPPSDLKVYGKILSMTSKSNNPLQGELFGTSGWWGFRTDTNNAFHVDIYNSNNPISALSINQVGDAGIGTTNPQSKLHVAGGGFFQNRLVVQGDIPNDNNAAFWNYSTNGFGLYSQGGSGGKYSLHFLNQAGVTIVYGGSNGNVGIGTSYPQYTLDVAGSARVNDGLDIGGPVIVNGGRLTQIGDLPNDNNAAFVNTSTTGYGFYSSGGGSGKYAFHFLSQNGSTILYGGGNGNIGIGTLSPSSRLNIIGTSSASNGVIDIGAIGSNTNLKIGLNVDYAWMQSYGSRPLRINELGNDILLNPGGYGNVGIGTTSPDSKLAVNGTIHAKEVKVDLTGWSDFVFDPNYKLRSLEEIDSYIKVNKHLPDLPSAKDVEANGVNLGDMNKILLQKIEELTLYILNQEKRISELEKLNNNK